MHFLADHYSTQGRLFVLRPGTARPLWWPGVARAAAVNGGHWPAEALPAMVVPVTPAA